MPRTKKRTSYTFNQERVSAKGSSAGSSLSDKLQGELKSNQSYLNLILGLVIVLVAGVLVFNYLKKNQTNLGPSQQTTQEEALKDLEPGNLPGKYTVKEGDTLFTIAQTYYNDGYKFPNIASANNITDVNILEAGQVLEIPKLEDTQAQEIKQETKVDDGTGGAVNQTIWGEKIEGDSYTVIEGDWLSTIAGRAYGDIMAFEKIAQANNIPNPDHIEPGMVLKIPR